MSQKVQIYKNLNDKSLAYGKYYVRPVYDNQFITTETLAAFIQTQCTVKRSDIKAVLDELGSAMKHFFEMGQKIKIDNIGVFKVGVISSPSDTKEACSASNVKSAHVIFSPETVSVPNGKTSEARAAKIVNGAAVLVTRQVRGFNHPAVMLQDIRFELAKDSENSSVNTDTTTHNSGGGNASGPSAEG